MTSGTIRLTNSDRVGISNTVEMVLIIPGNLAIYHNDSLDLLRASNITSNTDFSSAMITYG
jgi:hypothetical protein